MQRRWWWPARAPRKSSLEEEVGGALAREILRTELLRVRVVLTTMSLLLVTMVCGYWLFPTKIEAIWHGSFSLKQLLVSFTPFLAFETYLALLLRRRLSQGRDIPVWRRYIGVLVETSLPTVGIYLQMESMGANQALAFAAPLGYFIFIILSTLRLDFWLSTFTGFVAAAELLGVAMLYHPPGFADHPAPDFAFHFIRSVVVFTCGVLAGGVGLQLRRQFEASLTAADARDRVTNLFGQHVSPQVVDRLLSTGASGEGEVRKVVVMFADFRNFTGGARERAPDQVVARLDEAFAILVEILDRHGGIVNKFLGDGFLALFGAPIEDADAASQAVAAAREMIAAMHSHNDGHDWPLRIGIGIHTGDVVVGNVGSPRRKEYTVIGDTVNFASRLESLNKEFGTQLLISSAMRDEVGAAAADASLIGHVPVRGYAEPLAVWRID
ncbi:adenylate/guanylate cyclase domain-containing protein [Rhodopseudomonas sp. B29]|uniref:adenylate/guanylate cyclase domain-containing protein n=1 Tax=Rhodopseudomonas sp. B29 TaxID=95607 RepID=UPI0004CF5670|nr:adenylate/guanylate cyclase domain-containing protein [Rhodopseudomonas sp. B29]